MSNSKPTILISEGISTFICTKCNSSITGIDYDGITDDTCVHLKDFIHKVNLALDKSGAMAIVLIPRIQHEIMKHGLVEPYLSDYDKPDVPTKICIYADDINKFFPKKLP